MSKGIKDFKCPKCGRRTLYHRVKSDDFRCIMCGETSGNTKTEKGEK